jgi:leader peptidase (prepilin peptidase)/N-methyltransferase
MAVGAALGLASTAGAVMAGGALFLVGWVSSRRLGREALGLGDVKLAAAGGALLGPVLVWSAIAAAAIGTAAIAVALAGVRKRALSRDLEIPFGPGLLAAIFAAWIAAGGAAAGG